MIRCEFGLENLILWRNMGWQRRRTLRCSRNARRRWNCVCSVRLKTKRKHREFSSPSVAISSGIAICPMFDQDSSTDIGSEDRMNRPMDTGSTTTKSSSIPTPRGLAEDARWCDEMWGYRIGDPQTDLSFDDRDNAHAAPLAVVIDPAFTWGDDRPPERPWHETIIYEVHVKGFTKLHPGVPEELRGTYAGLTSPAALEHLKSLGVTAVELLPVYHRNDDRHLIEKGLCNYWGYNTLAFFAPDQHYSMAKSADETVKEFKTMVRVFTLSESRSCSTSFTTIRRKGTRWALRCRFVGSTMHPIIGCPRKIRVTTWTSPDAATDSTCGRHACCS